MTRANNVLFDFTPGTDNRTQELIAALKETGERLDAAHQEIARYHEAFKQQHERKLEQIREAQS